MDRTFTPFPRLLIPVIPKMDCDTLPRLAADLGGAVDLVGLVPVPEGASLSHGASLARDVRLQCEVLSEQLGSRRHSRVHVSHRPIDALLEIIQRTRPDVLLLEWPAHFEALGLPDLEALPGLPCSTVVARGPWPEQLDRILVPLRGGPYAELALRTALALPRRELLALHLMPDASSPAAADAPFRGLARVLPSLEGIIYQVAVAPDPGPAILQQAAEADLLVIGASAPKGRRQRQAEPFSQVALRQSPGAVLVVKTSDPLPENWSGLEGERTGAQAISLLVDQWFAENTYHADEFSDLERLLALKQEQGVTISLALPALNEEETVGTVISTIKNTLYHQVPLLDEIVLIDSDSKDRTRDIAKELGVPVYIHQAMLPELGSRRGKGEALWKSLLATRGDIVIWIDTDIVNIDPRFVYGVIGPLLVDPDIQFVKGFYQRPLRDGAVVQQGGGGRVTELMARPVLNLFYPELSGVIQPLSGEYGGRRAALEQMPFFSGYGVEIGLLIEVFERFGLNAIAQVDLLERVHHNQSLEALSKMAFTILQAVTHKLEKRFNRDVLEEVNRSMKLIRFEAGNYYLDVEEVAEHERPPMISIPEYLRTRSQAPIR